MGEDSSFAAALTSPSAPRQGGSQKWPSPSATCHFSKKRHIAEKAKLRSCSSLIHTHILGVWKITWARNQVELDLLIFFLYLLFVNICRNCSAQKCFQDCHQRWLAWVRPRFIRGATESGQLFPAMTNKEVTLWLLAHSQLSRPPASNRGSDRWCPWRIFPRTWLSSEIFLLSFHKKENQPNKKDTGGRKTFD